MIPHGLFVLFSAALASLGAEHELRASHAAAFGQALAWGGAKDPKLRRQARQLARLAFPAGGF